MATRKFEDDEIVIVGANMPQYEQKCHKLIPGTEVKIASISHSGGYVIVSPTGSKHHVYSKYLLKQTATNSIDKFTKLIEDAKTKIERTKQFIAETQAKIEFMKEVGTDTFDENEFKAFHTLTIIEQSDMSKIEKAKAIAALIAGK